MSVNTVKSLPTQQVLAREKVILEHLPLVHLLAKRLKQKLPHNIDYDDLVSAGVIGLLTAVDRFDHKRGVKFKTYAEFRIRGAMIDELRDLDILTRGRRRQVKASENQAFHSSHRATGPSEGECGRVISFEDALAKRQLKNNTDQNVLLDSAIAHSNNQLVAKAMGELGDREGKILHMYYYEGQTLRQIGRMMGLCQARISQLHGEAKAKLQDWLTFNFSESTESAAS
ncbi:MAG: sigma-70 family RNA polymerase sigma factor [Bdellovibrio sp.]|nr:sigma-70 family RNA polymerase sigma factor [Bdellovibrio sp.]